MSVNGLAGCQLAAGKLGRRRKRAGVASRRVIRCAHLDAESRGRRQTCIYVFLGPAQERIKKRVYKTRDLARADVFDYIEMFYDPTRRHTHLGGVRLSTKPWKVQCLHAFKRMSISE